MAAVASAGTECRRNWGRPLFGIDGIYGNRVDVGEEYIGTGSKGCPVVIVAVQGKGNRVVGIESVDKVSSFDDGVERGGGSVRLIGNIPSEEIGAVSKGKNLFFN